MVPILTYRTQKDLHGLRSEKEPPWRSTNDGDQVYRLLVGVALATITHPLLPYAANQAGTFLFVGISLVTTNTD